MSELDKALNREIALIDSEDTTLKEWISELKEQVIALECESRALNAYIDSQSIKRVDSCLTK